MQDCIFCKIAAGKAPCVQIYQDDRVLAFADINPISSGHTLIIPKVHAQTIWEISTEDLTAIHRASKIVADAIQKTLKPAGMAIVQLNGRAVNQVVMHYHLHLIPRAQGAPALPLTHWEVKPGNRGAIETVGAEIAAVIQG
jgi:histidine triad (HIT) family protein